MFKLVVLSALVAFVAAKPSGLLHAAPVAYAAAPAIAYSAPVVTKTVVAPSAVSSTYRQDVISEPVIAAAPVAVAHAAPVAYAAPAPVAYAAPVVTKTVVAPAAVSSTYRRDVINTPVVAAAPVVAKIAAPVAYAAPVVAKSVFAAPAVAYGAGW